MATLPSRAQRMIHDDSQSLFVYTLGSGVIPRSSYAARNEAIGREPRKGGGPRETRDTPTAMAAKSSTKSTTKRNTKRPPANAVETTTTSTVESAAAETRMPSHDEIARRAFELYLARGREHGRAKEDWLEAERELRARYAVN